MLLEFKFENHKSFRDQVSIDLRATDIKEYENRIRYIRDNRILTAAVIYGANASGKSNFFDAFSFFISFVKGEKLPQKPYFYSDNSSSSYEVIFTVEENTFRYRLELEENRIKKETLFKEKSGKASLIFKREGRKLDYSGISKKDREILTRALKRDELILGAGAKANIEELVTVFDWFSDCICLNLTEESNIKELLESGNYLQSITKLLSQVDQSITKVLLEENNIKLIHQRSGRNIKMDLSEESSGIRELLAIYPALVSVLETGGLLVLDEVLKNSHPLLLRDVIFTFLNWETNPFDSQIIITTNDISLLRKNFLRRDEIWFIDKDNRGISNLFSLTDVVDEKGRRVEREEYYDENYLLGKYGGIPSLKRFELFE